MAWRRRISVGLTGRMNRKENEEDGLIPLSLFCTRSGVAAPEDGRTPSDGWPLVPVAPGAAINGQMA